MRLCEVCLEPTTRDNFCSTTCQEKDHHRNLQFLKLSEEGKIKIFGSHINIVDEDHDEEGSVL